MQVKDLRGRRVLGQVKKTFTVFIKKKHCQKIRNDDQKGLQLITRTKYPCYEIWSQRLQIFLLSLSLLYGV